MKETNIFVVDSLMGTGKTSWAIQEIEANPDKAYIYCTPFLDEIERIQNLSDRQFYSPIRMDGRKLNGFNHLLSQGKNIALTHSTFSNADTDTLTHLSQGKYTLILDEVIDILVDYNEISYEKIKKGDIKLLRDEGFISCDRYGKVSWMKKSYPDSKFADVERMAKNGNLYFLDDSMLVWQFPPQIFELFEQVFVLTYMFDGSMLKPYFQYHKINYELKSIYRENDIYKLVPYRQEDRHAYKSLIHIYNNPAMNNYPDSDLSKAFYRKACNTSSNRIKKLKNNLFNFFRNIMKAKAQNILWTCPKDFYKKLKGRGYTFTRKPRKNESEKDKKKAQCFLACNAKATNDFRDRNVLAYACNIYCNPYIERYFKNKNESDGTEIGIDTDKFALSCMLQWIWRSSIRDKKPIDIYIPSTRMRTLLINWLNGI